MDDQRLTNRPTYPSPETLRELLAEENTDLANRTSELLAAAERAPEQIADDEQCGKLSAFLAQIQKCVKSIKSKHAEEKAIPLELGRAVDGFFFKMRDDLVAAYERLNRRNTEYLSAKAAAERRRREEEARQAEEERQRREAEARAAIGTVARPEADAAIDAATQAASAAEEATKAAEAKAAEMARTRSDYGTTATLRTDWTGEVEDRATLDLEALRQHLGLEELNKAVRAFVRAGGRELRGARIWERQVAINR